MTLRRSERMLQQQAVYKRVFPPTKRTKNKKNKAKHVVVVPRQQPKRGTRKTISSRKLNTIVNTTSPLGVVDPASKIRGSIVSLLPNNTHDSNADGEPCDVMLVMIDQARNTDNFYILQLIERTRKTKPYTVYTRWGRTGNVGTGAEVSFDNLDDAVASFEKTFKTKTGVEWDDRDEEESPDGKYRYIQQNYVMKRNGYRAAKWQYWVDDGIDGKRNGWHDYTPEGSVQTEQLFMEHQANPNFSYRVVQSGIWSYGVDLMQMTQTNITHSDHTSRRIRRVLQNGRR